MAFNYDKYLSNMDRFLDDYNYNNEKTRFKEKIGLLLINKND